jgi:hypothetical protein
MFSHAEVAVEIAPHGYIAIINIEDGMEHEAVLPRAGTQTSITLDVDGGTYVITVRRTK